MDKVETSMNIRCYGTMVDPTRNRVTCNLCSKEMSGFARLKYHLGGVGPDVTACSQVPDNVKSYCKNMLTESRKYSVGKKARVGKRDRCSTSNGIDRPVFVDPESEDTADENPIRQIDLVSMKFQKCIGRFSFENDIDHSAVKSMSFQEFLSSELSSDLSKCKLPSLQDLKGQILQYEVKEMQEYEKNIKKSWATTGCTVSLDSWTDKNGRELVSFIADSPAGSLYLSSFDISDTVDNIDALVSLVERVINKVGVDNVVQVMACSSTGWIGNVGERYRQKNEKMFWSISASHCIQLMLEEIGRMENVRLTLNKAKILTKFIHGNGSVLTLFKHYSRGHTLIRPSMSRSATPFLILESIMLQKQNLIDMAAGTEWKNSAWANSVEGYAVVNLMADSSFWKEVETIVKASKPLIHFLCSFNGDKEPKIGLLYEFMDQVKEEIKANLGDKNCKVFWDAIDKIWNTKLHSDLHAAGYYLNPAICYSTNCYLDGEVVSGMIECVVRTLNEHAVQVKMVKQLQIYRNCQGDFEKGVLDETARDSPVEWWTRYGAAYPELQRFAIRIISQTCNGASKYRLKRSLAEKLLRENANESERQYLKDLSFVHYNLQLQRSKWSLNDNILADEIDPNDIQCRTLNNHLKNSRVSLFLKWKNPKTNGFKLNTDGTCDTSGEASGGGIVRNHSGDIIFGLGRLYGKKLPIVTECSALLDGLLICRMMNITSLDFETDSKILVDLLLYKKASLFLAPLIKCCRKLISSSISINNIHREQNSVVD